MVRVPARGAALSPPPADGAPEPGEAPRPTAGKRRWHLLAALVAVLVLAGGFARDFHLPGLYMDSINPEYMAVLALVDEARPDTPVQVLPGNLIAGRYPVLAGSYYHGPLQYYVALPVYALLGTDLTAARVVQLAYAVLVLLAMALVLAKARVAPGFAAGALALLALDPAFVLTFKTQAYNVTWPLAWLFLGIATVEHWASRRRPPAWRESLGAGLFAGIAFFCYFVHLFFLPALAWYLACQLRATGVRDGKRMAGVFALHGAGFSAGGLLYLWGYQRAASALGGWDRFVAGFRGTVETLVAAAPEATLAGKFATTWRSISRALDDEWVSRMVLKSHGDALLGDTKLVLVLLLPLALLVALPFLGRRSRLLELCVLGVLGYAVLGTLVAGTRLGPYHFAVLLPLLYLGSAAGLAAAWPALREGSPGRRRAGAAVVGLACVALAVDSIAGHAAFSAKLRRSGGFGFFSDAVTTYAERALASPGTTAYYFPTWGLSMPFVYLTGGRERTRLREPTPDEIRASVCDGTAVEVAYLVVGGGEAFAARSAAAGGLRPALRPLHSRDGHPVIEVVRFEPEAVDAPACKAFRPHPYRTWAAEPRLRIALEPQVAACSGEPLPVQVAWDVTAAATGASVSVLVGDGDAWRLWTRAGARGDATTGPWARAGLQFAIVDDATGRRLAGATLGGGPCR